MRDDKIDIINDMDFDGLTIPFDEGPEIDEASHSAVSSSKETQSNNKDNELLEPGFAADAPISGHAFLDPALENADLHESFVKVDTKVAESLFANAAPAVTTDLSDSKTTTNQDGSADTSSANKTNSNANANEHGLSLSVSFLPSKGPQPEFTPVNLDESVTAKDHVNALFKNYEAFLLYHEGGKLETLKEPKLKPVVRELAMSMGDKVSIEQLAQTLHYHGFIDYLRSDDVGEEARSAITSKLDFVCLQESSGKNKLADFIKEPTPENLPSAFKQEMDTAFNYLQMHVHEQFPELPRSASLSQRIDELNDSSPDEHKSLFKTDRDFNDFMRSISPKERLNYIIDSNQGLTQFVQDDISGLNREDLRGKLGKNERSFKDGKTISFNEDKADKSKLNIRSSEELASASVQSLVEALYASGATRITINSGTSKVMVEKIYECVKAINMSSQAYRKGGRELSVIDYSEESNTQENTLTQPAENSATHNTDPQNSKDKKNSKAEEKRSHLQLVGSNNQEQSDISHSPRR